MRTRRNKTIEQPDEQEDPIIQTFEVGSSSVLRIEEPDEQEDPNLWGSGWNATDIFHLTASIIIGYLIRNVSACVSECLSELYVNIGCVSIFVTFDTIRNWLKINIYSCVYIRSYISDLVPFFEVFEERVEESLHGDAMFRNMTCLHSRWSRPNAASRRH